ncbi:MAG: hypothetical protein IJM36_04360 [Acholeplasmatales bacterium]|nr:hypothetical protein [Acholeplasmatales bacterium]
MKSKIKIIIISALFIVSGVLFGVLAHNGVKKPPLRFDGDIDETTDVIIIDDEDIKTLDDYTVKEVLGIALGKVTTCNAFEVTTSGTSNAITFGTTTTVKISNHRIVKDNEAFIECVSAGLISSGSQRFLSGGNAVLKKASKVNDDATAEFNNDNVEVVSDEEYKNRYGWLPYQMNGYIIRQETYLEDPTMTKNDDNTYTILVKLNPDSNAAFYYKREVVTNANATKEPVFKEIRFEIKIDENFVIKEVKTHERYDVTVNMFIDITSDTTTETVDTYNYNNVSFDETLYNYYKGKLLA